MIEFRMPSLGADMDKGKLVEWLVKPGDPVARGQVVALVETDKGIIEVEIWEDGVVDRLLVAASPEDLPVGIPLALVRSQEAGAPPPEPAPLPEVEPAAAEPESAAPEPVPVSTLALPEPALAASAAAAAAHRPAPPVRHLARTLGVDLAGVSPTGAGGDVTRSDVHRAATPATAPTRESRVRVSPMARKRADELGVPLEAVTPSRPDGMIGVADVEAAARTGAPPRPPEAPPAPPAQAAAVATAPSEAGGDEERRAAAMRRAIGQVMARSKREIPHYYLGMHIDATGAMSWLAEENARRPMAQRLLPAVLLLKAAALAVHEVPEVNGFYVDDEFRPSEAVHLGVAVSLRAGGLIAPAIHDADHRTLDELMTALRDLVQRTRTGRLRSSEMSDPTITITNLGDRGVETVYGVIYAPQVALVGFGKVGERPWAVDGMLGVRKIVHTTLSADHRVSDGHRGGLYLAAIDRLLQEPEKL